MSTPTLQRPIYGFRFVETLFGDTLQTIAMRELGDAGRWPELVSFNKLRPPFITDDPAVAGDGVILTGAMIRVPSSTQQVQSIDPERVFEIDLALSEDGSLLTDGGDFITVSGLPNLHQALKNRLDTDQGELVFHKDYGSPMRRILGTVNGPTAAILASEYAKGVVLADPRIQSVISSEATVNGDSVSVDVIAQPIVGRSVQVTGNI